MHPALKPLYDHDLTPHWMKEVVRFWGVQSQFILHGNVYDAIPYPSKPAPGGKGDAPPQFLHLPHYLAQVLHIAGVRHLLEYDPIHGLAIHADAPFDAAATRRHLEQVRGFDPSLIGRAPRSFEPSDPLLSRVIEMVTSPVVAPAPGGQGSGYDHVALIVHFASRIAINISSLRGEEHDQFAAAMKRSITAVPRQAPGQEAPGFDPVVWVCEKENDLPTWLYHGNPRIRRIRVAAPDPRLRRAVAPHLLARLKLRTGVPTEAKAEAVSLFALQTEGMTLNDMLAIRRLAHNEGITVDKIQDAIRFYRTGVRRDAWQELDARQIQAARGKLDEAVIGQPNAIEKVLTVIKRAKVGLSGAQASRSQGRPRGVLFFAGPTGVGKTELAKAITELVAGDPTAYIRFDMSEFGAEHAAHRLIGAPPGYVGYDAGGELTNAVRARPFSVLLFDEIEKAHHSLLDKFLQMLDEGFITSGQGERVYLTETLIIFTSNLGIYEDTGDGKRELRVTPESHRTYKEVDVAVREAINRYFNLRLGRPELLNRLGENIVVFDFIRQGEGGDDVPGRIFRKLLTSVLARTQEALGVTVSLSAEAENSLRQACTRDLRHGGRGIGNELEEQFINPLSSALFDSGVQRNSRVVVRSHHESADGGVARLELEVAR